MFNSAELANFTPDERAKYQLDMTTERDIKNQIEYARDDGALKEAFKIAQALLELGVAIDIIAKGTGLSEEEVEALRQS